MFAFGSTICRQRGFVVGIILWIVQVLERLVVVHVEDWFATCGLADDLLCAQVGKGHAIDVRERFHDLIHGVAEPGISSVEEFLGDEQRHELVHVVLVVARLATHVPGERVQRQGIDHGVVRRPNVRGDDLVWLHHMPIRNHGHGRVRRRSRGVFREEHDDERVNGRFHMLVHLGELRGMMTDFLGRVDLWAMQLDGDGSRHSELMQENSGIVLAEELDGGLVLLSWLGVEVTANDHDIARRLQESARCSQFVELLRTIVCLAGFQMDIQESRPVLSVDVSVRPDCEHDGAQRSS